MIGSPFRSARVSSRYWGRLCGHVVDDALWAQLKNSAQSGSCLPATPLRLLATVDLLVMSTCSALKVRSTLNIELWLVVGLKNMHVRGSRNGLESRQQFPRQIVVLLHVRTGELDVDWSGQSKIEDLANDVRGLEIKFRTGELAGQSITQVPNVVVRFGAMVRRRVRSESQRPKFRLLRCCRSSD